MASGGQPRSIDAYAQGTVVEVVAQATIKAPYSLIWQTLTDYDHLAEFIAGMTRSHVVERRGHAVIVEQTGNARLLFLNYPIEVVVESLETPPTMIGIRVLRGNMRQLNGEYRIQKIESRTDEFILTWSGQIEPSFPLPQLITVPLLRSNISDQFTSMVTEIERREALRASGQYAQKE